MKAAKPKIGVLTQEERVRRKEPEEQYAWVKTIYSGRDPPKSPLRRGVGVDFE
ncbi:MULTISPECIES: hypothetical protein [unclassified Microcoleus]|uniref:hypothetical protein n=1 Tax=unclassified Microcoleus TaxID=2642155 RepID=UPI002FD21AFC